MTTVAASSTSQTSQLQGRPSAPVGDRIQSVDFLRGIASFAVCYLHLTSSLPQGMLRSSGAFGNLGVQLFFVISGFVIPFSLHRAGYKLRDYATFILKRVMRVDPPYLVVIALIVPLGYVCAATPGFKGPPYSVTAKQVLLHLGYLNSFFHQEWLSPVFWTLAIEFQYYLTIGLLFSLISHKSLLVRSSMFGVLAALGVVFSPATYSGYVLHWLFLFMFGILTFQRISELATSRQYWIQMSLFTLGTYFTLGPVDAAVGAISSIAILLLKTNCKPILFLGSISYSLYLIHNPTGVKLVNLGSRFVATWQGHLVILTLGLVLSIVAASILHRFVERPAQKWASKLAYCRKSIPKGSQA